MFALYSTWYKVVPSEACVKENQRRRHKCHDFNRAACKRDGAAIIVRRAQTLLWSENTTFDLVLLKIHPEIASVLFNHLNISSAGRPKQLCNNTSAHS